MSPKFGLFLLMSLVLPQLASAATSGKMMCGIESRDEVVVSFAAGQPSVVTTKADGIVHDHAPEVRMIPFDEDQATGTLFYLEINEDGKEAVIGVLVPNFNGASGEYTGYGDYSVGSSSGSTVPCSVQFSAETTPTISHSNDHYFEKELMSCELASTGRPVAIKYWKNFGYADSRSNNEGIHLGTTDQAEPYIGLAISGDLEKLDWALTPEKFSVKHWDLFMIGTSMRASIEVNNITGQGSISYRQKICQWGRCFEDQIQDRLKNCTTKVELE